MLFFKRKQKQQPCNSGQLKSKKSHITELFEMWSANREKHNNL